MTPDSVRNGELAALEMFREALQSWRWADVNQPGSARLMPLFERIADRETYVDFKRTELGGYLVEVAEALDEAMNDDWMPDHIFGLPLSQAMEFLISLTSAMEQETFSHAHELRGLNRQIPCTVPLSLDHCLRAYP